MKKTYNSLADLFGSFGRMVWAVVAAVVLLGVGIGILVWLNRDNHAGVTVEQRIDITPTQLQQIRDIGQWEFLAVSDEELVDTVRRGFLSDAELVRIYYGTLRLGIDFSKASRHWFRVEGDSVVVAQLPPVRLLDTDFIDEARTRSFFEKGDWTAADREQLYQRAYRKMLARCMTKENLHAAEENAHREVEKLLKSLFRGEVRMRAAASPGSSQEGRGQRGAGK
ncbi:DUF4230 domain-containing protein [Prevotella dentasini]|uniref:DUF4230 domain-containing protein n=1 Tax=Prevotella dentasini TaxID=589537 RepID=UPI00046B099A